MLRQHRACSTPEDRAGISNHLAAVRPSGAKPENIGDFDEYFVAPFDLVSMRCFSREGGTARFAAGRTRLGNGLGANLLRTRSPNAVDDLVDRSFIVWRGHPQAWAEHYYPGRRCSRTTAIPGLYG